MSAYPPSVDGIYRGFTLGLTYREVLHLEMERHLAVFVAELKRPPWWRPWARKLYAMKVKVMRDHHTNNMLWLLVEHDPRRRALMANLIGWRLPRDYADDLVAVVDSPDPDIRAMVGRLINIKLGVPPDDRVPEDRIAGFVAALHQTYDRRQE